MLRYEYQSDDEKVGTIYRTKDYSKFHFNKYNRQIDKPHLRSLMTNIQLDKAVVEPIQVDDEFNIVDGQHRFLACKKLGMPVDYFVDRNVKAVDADLLNSKAKKWSLLTYIQRGVNVGDPDYIKLYKQIQKWGGYFSVSIITELYAQNTHRTMASIRNRDFVYKDNPVADSFLEDLAKKIKYSNHGLSKPMLRALFTWYSNKHVDRKRLIKIVDQDLIANRGATTTACMTAIGEAYNRNLTVKRRINYYVTADNRFFFDF